MKFFHVVLGKKHIDLIKAESPEDAIKRIELMYGPSESLSKLHRYEAVEA